MLQIVDYGNFQLTPNPLSVAAHIRWVVGSIQ
jgi:hypothetical protein